AYHSAFNSLQVKKIGSMAILPVKTKKGMAALKEDGDDIIDEALALFRANVFFRNFEIQGDADRVLIYLILFISECLNKINKNTSYNDGQKILGALGLENNFVVPGDAGFPLAALYSTPANRNEADTLRQYIGQLRQELVNRLIPILYPTQSMPSKWWMSFQKRKFMNKSF
ncbi:actin-related protein 2/3 complex subunit 3, partial [Rozella allomycis CSF55]